MVTEIIFQKSYNEMAIIHEIYHIKTFEILLTSYTNYIYFSFRKTKLSPYYIESMKTGYMVK